MEEFEIINAMNRGCPVIYREVEYQCIIGILYQKVKPDAMVRRKFDIFAILLDKCGHSTAQAPIDRITLTDRLFEDTCNLCVFSFEKDPIRMYCRKNNELKQVERSHSCKSFRAAPIID